MARYALLLAYDGTDFSGWWRQPQLRSIAGELDAAFARLGEPAALAVGASRTDAGVHARGQVAHVDCVREWAPAELARALERQLPPQVVCRGVSVVDPTWHAVHDSLGKTYRYRFDIGGEPDPFLAPRMSWRLPFPLSVAALQMAAKPLMGDLDLSAFARRGEYRDNLRTHLSAVRCYQRDRYLVVCIRGSRFGYRLVRSVVGGMVATASGTVSSMDWQQALAGVITPAAQQQAPARGLCLERVHYAQSPQWVRGVI